MHSISRNHSVFKAIHKGRVGERKKKMVCSKEDGETFKQLVGQRI